MRLTKQLANKSRTFYNQECIIHLTINVERDHRLDQQTF